MPNGQFAAFSFYQVTLTVLIAVIERGSASICRNKKSFHACPFSMVFSVQFEQESNMAVYRSGIVISTINALTSKIMFFIKVSIASRS